MYTVRINNVTVQIRGQNVYIIDVFNDVSNNEVASILSYISEEGFIKPENEINVFFKSKKFYAQKKEKQK